MRTITIETRPSYKLEQNGPAISFGNVEVLDSKKNPIKAVQVNVPCAETLDEFVNWLGGKDLLPKAIEYVTRLIASKVVREPLIGNSVLVLGQKGEDYRNDIVQKMVTAGESLVNINALIMEEAAESAKVNFADEAVKLDPTDPEFTAKFAALRAKFGL